MKKLLAFLLFAIVAVAQGPTTPNLGLHLPPHGYSPYDVPVNSNFSVLDSIFDLTEDCSDSTHAVGWNNSLKKMTCQTISGGGGSGCSEGVCLVNDPTADQTINGAHEFSLTDSTNGTEIDLSPTAGFNGGFPSISISNTVPNDQVLIYGSTPAGDSRGVFVADAAGNAVSTLVAGGVPEFEVQDPGDNAVQILVQSGVPQIVVSQVEVSTTTILPAAGGAAHSAKLPSGDGGTISIVDFAACGSGNCSGANSDLNPIVRYGNVTLNGASPATASITGLPYTSSASYVCGAWNSGSGSTAVIVKVVNSSATTSIITTSTNGANTTVGYHCEGS